MLSLVLKIFLAYWCAAAIVILISDFGSHWTPHNPVLADALNASLSLNGRELIRAYQMGTCAADPSVVNGPENGAYLAEPDGRVVCGNPLPKNVRQLVATAAATHKLAASHHNLSVFVALPVRDSNGAQYILILQNRYRDLSQFGVHRPGNTSIAISGVVTFLLALLIVYPIRKLRRMTHQIAAGNLEARITTGGFSRLARKLHLQGDLDDLMGDFNTMASHLESLVLAHRFLLRDVSHELRSPLARLAVALELERESNPQEPNTHLDRIELESVRLNGLIAQILAFSYVENISELCRMADLSLNSLVHDLLPDVQYEAESRKCRIVQTSRREAVVNGDCDMLRHAVENIVRNAIRYSPAGGMVEIEIDTTDHEGRDMAILRVTDTGPGVSEDKLELILNPFYRVEESRRSSTSGFGVGLAIADRAAYLHSGKIAARNRKCGGLIIEMSLPLASQLPSL